MKERGLSFKEALNSGLRAGLLQSGRRNSVFTQKTYAMGSEQNFRWDKALEAAEALGDEELSRKLSLGK